MEEVEGRGKRGVACVVIYERKGRESVMEVEGREGGESKGSVGNLVRREVMGTGRGG